MSGRDVGDKVGKEPTWPLTWNDSRVWAGYVTSPWLPWRLGFASPWLTGIAILFCWGLLALLRTIVQSLSHVRRCDPMNYSTSGFPVLHHLLELAQTHVHWVGDAVQPSHPLSSPPAFNLSQHQSLFQWVNSSHQVTKVLELQLQPQSFQWIFRIDFL